MGEEEGHFRVRIMRGQICRGILGNEEVIPSMVLQIQKRKIAAFESKQKTEKAETDRKKQKKKKKKQKKQKNQKKKKDDV